MCDHTAGIFSKAAYGGQAILIADPELSSDSSLTLRLLRAGYKVVLARSIGCALASVVAEPFAYAVTELSFEDGSCLDLLKLLQSRNPVCRTIVHSTRCDVPTAVWLTHAGAADVLPKPADIDLLVALLLETDWCHSESAATLARPEDVRRAYIRDAYFACGQNLSATARQVSMHRRTLQRTLGRMNLRQSVRS